MSVMVFVFIRSVALVHLDKFRSLSFLKSFNFSLHYSCYIQYKLWRLRYSYSVECIFVDCVCYKWHAYILITVGNIQYKLWRLRYSYSVECIFVDCVCYKWHAYILITVGNLAIPCWLCSVSGTLLLLN